MDQASGSEEPSKGVFNIAGYDVPNSYWQDVLRRILTATKASTERPFAGDEFACYSTFERFRDAVLHKRQAILPLMTSLVQEYGLHGKFQEHDLQEHLALLIDSDDDVLEHFSSMLDETSGIKKSEEEPILAAKPPSVTNNSWNKKDEEKNVSVGSVSNLPKTDEEKNVRVGSVSNLPKMENDSFVTVDLDDSVDSDQETISAEFSTTTICVALPDDSVKSDQKIISAEFSTSSTSNETLSSTSIRKKENDSVVTVDLDDCVESDQKNISAEFPATATSVVLEDDSIESDLKNISAAFSAPSTSGETLSSTSIRKRNKKKKRKTIPEISLISASVDSAPPPKKPKTPEVIVLDDDPYDYSQNDYSAFTGKKKSRKTSKQETQNNFKHRNIVKYHLKLRTATGSKLASRFCRNIANCWLKVVGKKKKKSLQKIQLEELEFQQEEIEFQQEEIEFQQEELEFQEKGHNQNDSTQIDLNNLLHRRHIIRVEEHKSAASSTCNAEKSLSLSTENESSAEHLKEGTSLKTLCDSYPVKVKTERNSPETSVKASGSLSKFISPFRRYKITEDLQMNKQKNDPEVEIINDEPEDDSIDEDIRRIGLPFDPEVEIIYDGPEIKDNIITIDLDDSAMSDRNKISAEFLTPSTTSETLSSTPSMKRIKKNKRKTMPEISLISTPCDSAPSPKMSKLPEVIVLDDDSVIPYDYSQKDYSAPIGKKKSKETVQQEAQNNFKSPGKYLHHSKEDCKKPTLGASEQSEEKWPPN